MFARFFGKTRSAIAQDSIAQDSDVSTIFKARDVYADWRFKRDIAAVMSALDRLSDRRLDMIGVRRDAMFDAVSDMMLRAADNKAVADEVIAMLDRAPAGQEPREVAPTAAGATATVTAARVAA